MSIAIVNRDFGEHAGAIGIGLRRFAEYQASVSSVSIISTSKSKDLIDLGKNSNIKLFLAKSLSSSGSSIAIRLFELIYFALFVMFSLIKSRPKIIYVSSNPPLIIPFFVFLFCYITKSKYIYHVQDIHPEATMLVLNMPKILEYFAKSMDRITLKNSDLVITLSEDMKKSLLKRYDCLNIILLQNPAIVNKDNLIMTKLNGAIFCGNAGRLQNIDILLEAIEIFLRNDNSDFFFGFVGGGVFSRRICSLSKKFKRFKYYGYVSAQEAIAICSEYKWALLPIRTEVLKYAYPSKIPTYISAGCKIVSITSRDTELAKEIHDNDIGFNVEENTADIVTAFEFMAKNQDGFFGTKNYTFLNTDEFGEGLSKLANSIR